MDKTVKAAEVTEDDESVLEANLEDDTEANVDMAYPPVDDEDFIPGVEEAYWAEVDDMDVFGGHCFPLLDTSIQAAEKRKALVEDANRQVKAKLLERAAQEVSKP